MKNSIFFTVAFLSLLVLGACGTTKETVKTTETPKEVVKAEVKPTPPPPVVEVEKPAAPGKAKQEKELSGPKVLLETDYGAMTIVLFDETPQHRDNFLKLANEKYFDDLLFHRVIKGFMIQGGDPNSRGATAEQRLGNGGPGYTVPAEFNDDLIHLKGALSAARQGDQVNPKKASSGSQFYVVQGRPLTDAELSNIEVQKRFKYTDAQRKAYMANGGTPFLDRDYTVFGQVVEGLDVIDKIAAVQTARGDRPLKDVKMKITVLKAN